MAKYCNSGEFSSRSVILSIEAYTIALEPAAVVVSNYNQTPTKALIKILDSIYFNSSLYRKIHQQLLWQLISTSKVHRSMVGLLLLPHNLERR